MKKLFALLVVAGMTFFACGSNNEEAPVEEEAMEVEVVNEEANQEENVAEMPAEEASEEAVETPAE